MKTLWKVKEGNRRVIVLFSGWGVDPASLPPISKKGYDVAILYDYTPDIAELSASGPAVADSFLHKEMEGYAEVVVIAWSFGVAIASSLTFGSLPVTLRIAVNGTPFHVDDKRGIPKAIFQGTLSNLNERNLLKFNRRMCGSSDRAALIRMRPLSDVLPELAAFGNPLLSHTNDLWDKAIVSTDDAIFPPANQEAAWERTTSVERISGPHLPDFQAIVDRYVKDKMLVADKFGASQSSYADNASVQRCVASRLWQLWQERVDYYTLESAIEIGCGDGTFTRVYAPQLRVGLLTLWDIAACDISDIDRCLVFNQCDAETTICKLQPDSIDLILSSSTLQWMNSPAAFLRQAFRVLKPGGHCLLSVYGEGTFSELAQAAGMSLVYPSMADISRWTTQFRTVASEADELQLHFPSPREALAHVKATGVNALRRQPLSVGQMRRLLADYPLAPGGSAAITFRPFYLILKKPT